MQNYRNDIERAGGPCLAYRDSAPPFESMTDAQSAIWVVDPSRTQLLMSVFAGRASGRVPKCPFASGMHSPAAVALKKAWAGMKGLLSRHRLP